MKHTTPIEGGFCSGALPGKIDLRDKKYGKLAMASEPFDWDAGYDVEKTLSEKIGSKVVLKAKHQGPSSSCGGQSGSYFDAVIEALGDRTYAERSAKFIYSHIFYPGGGTTLRDLLNFIVKKGDCLESLVPSYKNGAVPDEAFMRDLSSISEEAHADAVSGRGLGYAFVNTDIDSIAQAVRDNHGAIIQIDGQNNGTWRSAFPLPPSSRNFLWSHFVYVGKAKMIKGKKYIGFINSWGKETGENGWQWIGEDYFKGGFVFKAGVIYSKDSAVIIEQQITLMTKVVELLQKLISMLAGPSKLPLTHQ